MDQNNSKDVKGAALKAAKKGKGFVTEFKTFMTKGNVLDLAVGVLIGSAFGNLVTSLTDNIISPILGIFSEVDFSGFVININVLFIHLSLKIGQFLTDVINFVIMAFVIFLIVKAFNKLKDTAVKKEEEKPAAPKKTNEEVLLEEIRDLLKEQNEKPKKTTKKD